MGGIIFLALFVVLIVLVALAQMPSEYVQQYDINGNPVAKDSYFKKLALRNRIKKNLSIFFRAGVLETITNEIIQRYNEPWRAYHNMNHINAILDMLEDNIVIFGNKEVYSQLFLVAVYHDIVYKPWKKNNEEKSAELFKEHWRKYSMKAPNQSTVENFVYNCILQTKNHDGKKHLEHVFNSLDMSIISGTSKEVMEWEQGIAKEYSFIPYNTYKKHRLKFLEEYKQHGNISKIIEYVQNSKKRNNYTTYFIRNYFKYYMYLIRNFFSIDI